MNVVGLYVPFIIVHLSLFAYYKYLAIKYLHSSKNNAIVILNSLIPLCPVTIYAICLIRCLFEGYTETILEFYYIEWCVTIPIIINSIQLLKMIEEWKYAVMILLSLAMNLSGYLSFNFYINHYNYTLVYSIIGAAGVFYLVIMLLLYNIYRYNNDTIENQSQYENINNSKLYGKLIWLTYISWLGYPVMYILFLNHIVSGEYLILSFNILDLASKGLFAFLPIGYEMIKVKANTLATRVTTRIAQIAPEIPTDVAEPGEADYTITDVPQVTHTALYQPYLSQYTPTYPSQVYNVRQTV